MDPDAALQELRTLANGQGRNGAPDFQDIARMMELFQALDEWMTNGGFLPTEWNALRSPLKS